jgi:TRAP transporter 4TM/12TM fusion protein
MHFFGVFMQVHFEAKRSGLRGLTAEELPDLRDSFRRRWPTIIPLVLLITILMSGFTPYLAAFVGISSCLIVGLTTREKGVTGRGMAALVVLHALLYVMVARVFGDRESIALFLATVVATPFVLRALGIEGRIALPVVTETLETGAKYALAVGAAAATVGIVIGVVTLTGVGFKVSYIVTSAAQTIAGGVMSVLPAGWADPRVVMLLAALVMTGLVCILMGCGIPTTANYLIMVTVAAPTLVQLGVEPIVAHFFVFYYGVLADITPPVCIAAYAAAGMANADPFRTGNTAFRLGLGKALVPFVFVMSPSLLIVTKGFTWYDFTVTFVGCALGIVALSAALSNYFLVRMQLWERWLAVLGALLLIAPGLKPTLYGLALVAPIVIRHVMAMRKPPPLAATP